MIGQVPRRQNIRISDVQTSGAGIPRAQASQAQIAQAQVPQARVARLDFEFPNYTDAERRVDFWIHVAGVGGGIIAFIILLSVVAATATADALTVTSLIIYGLGMITMFSMSAAYNITDSPPLKAMLRRFDHAAIFVKTAGTYTPFALISIGGGTGAALFACAWIIALVGVPLKILAPDRLEKMGVWLYLGQGWLVVLAFEPLSAALSAEALSLLISGGLLYTVGVYFFLSERIKFHNAIWHAFVLAASACMYGAVLDSVALAAS